MPMENRTLRVEPQQVAGLLAAIQAGDAVACATLPIIQRELERLGCPPWMRRMMPFVKGASAIGLVVGRRAPRLGRLTTDALAAYFVCALGAHARVRDEAFRYVAAAGMLGIVLVARRAYREEEVTVLPAEAVIDLTEAHLEPDLPDPVGRQTS